MGVSKLLLIWFGPKRHKIHTCSSVLARLCEKSKNLVERPEEIKKRKAKRGNLNVEACLQDLIGLLI